MKGKITKVEKGFFKKAVLPIVSIMGLQAAFAQDMGMGSKEGFIAQVNELQPFSHLAEGHIYAFILSLILWLSLVYAVYSIVKYFRNK